MLNKLRFVPGERETEKEAAIHSLTCMEKTLLGLYLIICLTICFFLTYLTYSTLIMLFVLNQEQLWQTHKIFSSITNQEISEIGHQHNAHHFLPIFLLRISKVKPLSTNQLQCSRHQAHIPR